MPAVNDGFLKVGAILDFLLGHNESALFRRAQLKALVSIHSKEPQALLEKCKGGSFQWRSWSTSQRSKLTRFLKIGSFIAPVFFLSHNVSNVNSKTNVRLSPLGEPPLPRAAHVATAVGTMVVIQGGIGPTRLSAEDLHVLDLTQQRPRWHRVVVRGAGPGPRYGHVMALLGQRFLLAIGGNDGKRPLADVWALDTAAKPYEWRKLEPEGEGPPSCICYPSSCSEAKQHQLLVALLLCNAATMEIIREAICSRYGLAVGANFVGLVHILMIICYPIAYPIRAEDPIRTQIAQSMVIWVQIRSQTT
ncbi:Serine/threonine-phosphatase BSL2-like protein [Nymphaea thermarum]|nr:Serine/threonine-phosphatase BSL2-like protein [Nymphaea thermarum]